MYLSPTSAAAPKPTEVEDGEVDDSKISSIAATGSVVNQASTSGSTSETISSTPTVSSTTEPKKSEVLLRREQFQRDAAAKALPHPNVPTRPENSRNTTPNPLSHNLPSRPEAPFPSRQQLDRHRHGDRDRRDGRDPWLGDTSRTDRTGDRLREYPSNDRRGAESSSRDLGRLSDRNTGPDRERARLDPPRWTADSPREHQERTAQTSRLNENSGRLSRENVMPPARIPAASSDRGSSAAPERLSQINPERQELINPERAALISAGSASDIRSESPRRQRDDLRERPAPRPQSPKRHTSDRDFSDSRRDDRTHRAGPKDGHTSSRNQTGEPAAPPAGPRGDRPIDRASDRGDIGAFQPTPPQLRAIDPDHGRLNAGSRQQSDHTFGRLNSTTQDIPSGPRDRNPRGSRGPPRRDGRMSTDIPRPPTPEKQPPTGPSSGRHPRRTASGQLESISTTSTSLPATPAAPSPATSIHPDRLNYLGSQPVQSSPPPTQSTNPSPSSSIHPDRMKSFENDRTLKPSSTQTSASRSRPNVPSVVTGGPPSGPKASQASPITPGAHGLAAPTGPASTAERNNRNRRDRGGNQISSINTLLQQGGQQNSFDRGHRGRGGARGGGQSESHIPAQSTAAPPTLSGRPEARDLARDMVNPERVDLIVENAQSGEDRDRDRSSRRDRSGRHSRRSSRSPDRNRDPKRGLFEDDRASRSEHRDRRSDRGEGERHQGRSPHHESFQQGREMGGSSRETGRDRERDSSRRDVRDRDSGRDTHETGWPGERDRGLDRATAGRSRDIRGEMRGDERREGRGRDDNGRKRRSDEGIMDSRGHDKRPRRA